MKTYLTTISLAAASAVLMLVCQSAAHAETRALAQSPALACLTRASDAPALPEYPPETFARKEGGEINVELEFRGPDRAPKVRPDKSASYAELESAVERFAKHYRVPCMGANDAPVILRQRYVFVPNDGRKVVPSAPTDAADGARRAQLTCIVNRAGVARPSYPSSALRTGAEEKMMLRLRFGAPDLAPQLTWLTPPKHSDLRMSVEEYVSQLRMPCLNNGPIEMDEVFVFVIDGSARMVLRDMSLIELLRASKDYVVPAYFDFNAMACPFDVRLTYMRPYSPNFVGELDSSNPARKPLLEWMRNLTLATSESTQRKVLGDSMTVTIPCGKLDL